MPVNPHRFQYFVWFGVLVLLMTRALSSMGEDIDTSELPAPYLGQVDFVDDIRPILEEHCLRCHGPERPKAGFRLDNRESALNSGDYAPNIFVGMSEDSPLIHFVARLVPDMGMPPLDKGEPLRPHEIALLRAWIDQGLDYAGADQPQKKMLQFSITTGVGYIDVDGDAAKFRQNSRLNDGAFGGVTDFSASGPIDDRTDFQMDGRVVGGQNDARLRFDVRRENVGAIRGGVQTRRTWYDDSGGFHTAFAPPLFELGSDLWVDNGRAWIDFILDRDNLPYARLGYEFRFREGTKSTTQWGPVSPPDRNIYPSVKMVDEQTHIVKLDVAKDFSDWQVENNFRIEWHEQDNTRFNTTAFNSAKPGPEKFTAVNEKYQHTQGANTLNVQRWFRDWFMVGGGYLYSWVDANGSFDQSSALTTTAALPPTIGLGFGDLFWNSNQILLDQNSHVGSVSTKLGPWQDVLFYAGLQSDWMRQRGFSDVTQRFGSPTATGFPVLSYSDMDRHRFEQRAGVRFSGVPFTTFYGEGRWQQEEIGQREDQEFLGTPVLQRGTDADADLQQYRMGFNTSPWRAVMLGAHYQIINRNNRYTPTENDDSSGPRGDGYPNFIAARRTDADQVEARMVTRLTGNLKSTFTYGYEIAEYQTKTRALLNGTPAGVIDAANQKAHVFSAGLNWTPWSRINLNVTGSYADTTLESFANNSPAIVPYNGDVWSVISSAMWAVDELTELNLSHVWSASDYQQTNFNDGLPLGVRYQWHQLRAGIGRRLSDSVRVNLIYMFQLYNEPSAGGFNDYTANGLFASLTWSWAQ